MLDIFNFAKIINDIIKYSTINYPHKVALYYYDEQYAFREIYEKSNKIANGLIKAGLKKGDKVAVNLPNIPEYVIIYFALAKTGAVNVPINIYFTSNEFEYILENSDAVSLITTPQLLPKFTSIQSPSKLRSIVVIDRFVDDKRLPASEANTNDIGDISILKYSELLSENSQEDPSVPIEPEDHAIIFYTSGTTGFPKGAVCTHDGTLAACKAWATAYNDKEPVKQLAPLPLFHNAFYTFALTPLSTRGSVIILNKFSVDHVLEMIDKMKPTAFNAVPTTYVLMLNHPFFQKYDISSLKRLSYGATPMPLEVIKKVKQVFSNCQLYNVYGQAESTSAISIMTGEMIEKKSESVGLPMEGVTLKILDEEDQEVPPNTTGEICIRGRMVMKGYHKMPEETADTLRNGWLHTADLGYLDQDGYLYIVDRKKDMIIRGGENVYPKEIEEILYEHPEVLQTAVIGVPDKVMGEAVKAFIVPKSGEFLTEEEVIEFCKNNMAYFKVPKYVEFLEQFPLNAMGKILKTELRKRPFQEK